VWGVSREINIHWSMVHDVRHRWLSSMRTNSKLHNNFYKKIIKHVMKGAHVEV
jgi:hypothetical protein